MDGERYYYESDSDDELTRFLKYDPTVPAAEQPQQAPAAHVDIPPAYPSATADAPPIFSDEQMMMVGLPEAPAMPHHDQDQHMPGESLATMALQPDDHRVNELMLVVEQRLGQSPATVPPLPVDQCLDIVGESPSAMPLPHHQMLGDTPSTMLHHPNYHMINELLPVLEQRLGESPAAMPQHDGHGQHVMGEPLCGFSDLDDDLGIYGLFLENDEEHLPGGNGATGMPESPAGPSMVPPAAPEQPSCQDCHVVQQVRNHNAATGMVTKLFVHRASDGTYTHTVLETIDTGAQVPSSGIQPIYGSLRDCAPEDVPKIVEAWIRTMMAIVGQVEEVIIIDGGEDTEAEVAMTSNMVHAPPDAAGPSRAAVDTPKVAPPPPPPTHRRLQQPGRVLTLAEKEDEETRQYLFRTRAQAKEEMRSLPKALKHFCRDTKAPDNRNLMLHRIRRLNNKIKDSEKENWRVGSELTKIRRSVDESVIEKTRLYADLKKLMEKEDKNCNNFPARRNDDEAGGSGGATGAAVS